MSVIGVACSGVPVTPISMSTISMATISMGVHLDGLDCSTLTSTIA